MPTPPEGAQRSDDGHYWWDETTSAWQPIEQDGAGAVASSAAAAGAAAGGDKWPPAGYPADPAEWTQEQLEYWFGNAYDATEPEALGGDVVDVVAIADLDPSNEGAGLMGADSVVNTLASAWKLIKDGEATAEVASTTCNAVPHVDDWTDLGHASAPTPIAKLPIRNISPLGFTNVECDLTLVYQYGATYKGRRAFIPGLWITIGKCDVAFLFKLDVGLQVKTLTNANPGTPSPIAQMTLQISWHITNHLGSENRSADFTVFGDGRAPLIAKY